MARTADDRIYATSIGAHKALYAAIARRAHADGRPIAQMMARILRGQEPGITPEEEAAVAGTACPRCGRMAYRHMLRWSFNGGPVEDACDVCGIKDGGVEVVERAIQNVVQ